MRLLVRLGHRWGCNINADDKGIAWEGMDRLGLASDRDRW